MRGRVVAFGSHRVAAAFAEQAVFWIVLCGLAAAAIVVADRW